MTTVILSHLYPNPKRKTFGIFVEEETVHLSRHINLEVISPCVLPRNIPGLISFPKFEVRRGITVHRPRLWLFPGGSLFWMNGIRMARSVYRLLHRIQRVELLAAHNVFPDGTAAVYLGKKLGIPTIVILHGSDINNFALNPIPRNRRLRHEIEWTLRNTDGIIAVSTDLKRKAVDLGAAPDKVYVVPNGVDTELFHPIQRESCEEKLGLEKGLPRILFGGNLVHVKGLDILIESMGGLVKKFPRVELILIGGKKNSREERSLLKHAAQVGISGNVRSVGIISNDNIPLWMSASDVLVLPSRSEGFGVVLVEAIACGIPVISTLSGGPEDIVTNESGILVKPESIDELTMAMEKFCDGSFKCNRDKLACLVRGRFDYKTVTRRLADVYTSVQEGYNR